MNDRLLALYHRLPPPAQSAVAAARGYCLRRVRYGRATESIIDAATARERWTPDQWRRYQEAHLTRLLDLAARDVPFYRDYWRQQRLRAGEMPWLRLENWPLLDKEAVRRDPAAFVNARMPARRLWTEHTSGTTGKPLTLWRSARAVRTFYSIAELRERRWHGVSVRDRWAILGGQLVTPVARRRPPFWVWNPALSQLYMSVYHLAADLVPAYVDALERYRITYLWGYPSALATLAQHALALGLVPPAMHIAIASAEPVLDGQRELIRRAFGCRVVETYGSAELVVAASECAAGVLHLWPEVGLTEVFDEGRRVPDGTPGELVCTTLLNDGMPLIRYRTGDRGARLPLRGPCACGRTLPAVSALEGRSDDVLLTRDGRSVGRLDPVFKADLPLHEAQIVQETLDRIRVRVVPAPGFGEATCAAIRERVRARMGGVDVQVEPVGAIARSSGGKFRAVICCLPREQREAVRAGAAASSTAS